MISTPELSELLTTLYAAPLQHEKWQAFFDHLSRLAKISSGYLITGSQSRGQEILAGGGSSFNPDLLPLYRDYYDRLDPFWAPFLRNPRVAVMHGDELVSHDQLRRTEFYNDLLAGNEMEHMTMLSCSSTTEQTDVMPVWRRAEDGPMDDNSMALLQMLLPHAHTALHMRVTLHAANMQEQFSEMALDAMSMAAFLVTANGRIQHMNTLAADLLQKSDGMKHEGVFLSAGHATESEKLKLLIAGAASTGIRQSNAVPGGALNISRRKTQLPLHVCVLPVPEDRRPLTGATPCALVFVTDPAAVPRSRAAFMRMLYQLTPAESRVADLLLEGLEVREVADSLGITLETTRFHLKRVFARTGTRRQTELMRLMLSLPGR